MLALEDHSRMPMHLHVRSGPQMDFLMLMFNENHCHWLSFLPFALRSSQSIYQSIQSADI